MSKCEVMKYPINKEKLTKENGWVTLSEFNKTTIINQPYLVTRAPVYMRYLASDNNFTYVNIIGIKYDVEKVKYLFISFYRYLLRSDFDKSYLIDNFGIYKKLIDFKKINRIDLKVQYLKLFCKENNDLFNKYVEEFDKRYKHSDI